jgi:hypothetical protein
MTDREVDCGFWGFLSGLVITAVIALVCMWFLAKHVAEELAKPHMLTLIRSEDCVALIDTNAPDKPGRWIPLSEFREKWEAGGPVWKVIPYSAREVAPTVQPSPP